MDDHHCEKSLRKRLKAAHTIGNSPIGGDGKWRETCEECGDEMIISNYQRSCKSCGLIDSSYQAVEFVGGCYTTPKYKPSEFFEAVLKRLEGRESRACRRFDAGYINELSEKLDDDYSLRNIHKHLPNKDQRYLNYIHSQLNPMKRLYIKFEHHDFLKARMYRCYEVYMSDPDMCGKRPCALNMLGVVVDCYPETFDYIKPFIYTKFKLNNSIYNKLKDVYQSN